MRLYSSLHVFHIFVPPLDRVGLSLFDDSHSSFGESCGGNWSVSTVSYTLGGTSSSKYMFRPDPVAIHPADGVHGLSRTAYEEIYSHDGYPEDREERRNKQPYLVISYIANLTYFRA